MAGDVRTIDNENIRIVSLDNPPVNGLGAALRRGLSSAIADAIADDAIAAVVITGSGKLFCAGADIREFGRKAPPDTPALPDVINAIEASDKLIVAAIHGVAAGGGLELALGCHARVATPDARVGLPEVTLGIIPGAGGTQRLPRLVGVAEALELIVSGKLVPAAKAHAMGLVDVLADADVVAGATAFAKTFLDDVRTIERTASREVVNAPDAFDDVGRRFAKKTRGFLAPGKAIEAVRAATSLPFTEGLAKERSLFLELVDSEQAQALRHVFFAEREVAKIPDIDKSVRRSVIERVGIVGCGTMGGGIAMSFVDRGLSVVVVEEKSDALDKGLERIRGNYASSVAKGRISESEKERRLERLSGTLQWSELADVDIVIEAVFESMDVKRSVFRRLDDTCGADTILATNTSSLDIDEIAAATNRPDKVIGTHFFSPAHIMKLMETVRGDQTSKETVATVMALAKRIGKTAVLVGVCDGFVGNRMLYAYRRQADFLLEEGALPEQVDQALVEFGLPMGPFQMADLAGLDIGWAVRKRQAPSRPKDLRYSPIADRICEMGRFGQKSGAGWYRYEDGQRTPIADPVIRDLVETVSRELGFKRRSIDSEEIVKRCVYALINEGAKILEEGIALRSSDIDVVWIQGYGFPRYRGGPMFFGDQVGPEEILGLMSALTEAQGAWATPAPLIERLAREGGRFRDFVRPE